MAWRTQLRHGIQAGFAFFARSLQQVTTLAITLLAARYLSPAEYGVYTLSILFVMFLQALVYTGFFHYIIRAKGAADEILDTCFWLILGFSVAGAAILLVAAPPLARAFDAPTMAPVLRMLALTQPLAAITAWCSAVLMRHGRMRRHFNLMIAENLVSFGIGVWALIAWQSVFALVAYRVAHALGGTILYLTFGDARPGLRLRRAVAADAYRFSSHLYGTRTLNFLANYGADIALGLFFSTAEAGLYRFGNRIATGAVDVVSQPMRAFALSQFGAANRNDGDFGPILRRFSAVMLLLMGFVAGTLAVFAEEAIALFFDPAYQGALVVVWALSARSLCGLGNTFVEPVLAASGDTRAVLGHQAIWTGVQTATIPLVAGFGLGALAWSRAVVALLTSIAGLRLLARKGDLDLKPILAAMRRAGLLVLVYTAAAAGLHLAVTWQMGPGLAAFLTGLGLAVIACLGILAAAVKWRVVELRVFAG